MNEEEIYNSPNEREKHWREIRIPEDKKQDGIISKLDIIDKKLNKIISMLTAHDYACERRNKGGK